MKRFFMAVALATMSLGVFISCDTKETPVEDKIEINGETTIAVPVDGQIYNLSFSSNVAWKASLSAGAEAYVLFNPGSGTASEEAALTLQVKKNNGGDDREFTLTISGGTAKAEVKFTQEASATFKTDITSLKIGAEGGDLELPVSTNTRCTIEADVDWITVGSTKAMRDITYIVEVEANPTLVSRTGKVTVTPEGLDPVEIEVEQDKLVPEMTFGTYGYIPRAGGSFEVPFTTNISVFISVEGVDGVTAAYSDGAIVLTVPENEELAPRRILVQAIPEDFDVEEVAPVAVYVTQLGIAEIAWSVPITDKVDLSANVCPVAYNNGNLIIADGASLHVYSAADGSYVKSVTPALEGGVVPTSVASDDAGHFILAGTYASSTENAKVWWSDSIDSTPKELFSFTQDVNSAMGNFRVHGDVTGSAVVSATVSVSQYWAAFQITNGALEGTMMRAEHPAQQTTAWSPFYQVCEPRGSKIADGLFYSSYPGRQNVWFCTDPANNQWVVGFPTTNNGNQNSCSIDVVAAGGKDILLYMENSFFSYASPTFYIADITDLAHPAILGSMGSPFYSGGESNACYGGGGIVGHATSEALEIYVCDGGKNTLAKISVPLSVL